MPKITFIRDRQIVNGTEEPKGPLYRAGETHEFADASCTYFKNCGDAVDAGKYTGPLPETVNVIVDVNGIPTHTKQLKAAGTDDEKAKDLWGGQKAAESEGDGGEEPVKKTATELLSVDFESFDVPTLRAFAGEQSIDIKGKTTKPDIVKAITFALKAKADAEAAAKK